MENFCSRQILIPAILKISEGAIDSVGINLKNADFTNIACFFSAGIEEVFGKQIHESFNQAGIKIVHKYTINDTNIENIIHTAFSIPKPVDALVGIGGGKALDYSKYCAHVLALPFVSIPTSTSNDGFCSPISSLLVEKKRKTVKATIPYGVIVDINIISSSPDVCIYSGIGDLISKITANWDWKKAIEKGEKSFNDLGYLISRNTIIDFSNYQMQNIRNPKFLDHLVNALLMSGISMEIAGSSRPASGSEHLISHAYDMISDKTAMHGIQVGISTYLCSYLQENQFELVRDFLVNTGFFNFLEKNPLNKDDFIKAVKKAPSVKEMFYTILSEPEIIPKAIDFINNDAIFKKVLKNT